MNYQTIQVRFEGPFCYLQFHRPEASNTINNLLIEECFQVLNLCEKSVTGIIIEGLPEIFCLGADFEELCRKPTNWNNSESLYDLWLKLATGPYITIAHVRGRVNAGGIGFVAASDIVIADQTAQFSLSELLFGLFPACVLPFLIRRVGHQKAHYLTLMTSPISVSQAFAWGLVDECTVDSDSMLHKYLLRLRHLSKKGISGYKQYMNNLDQILLKAKPIAIAANSEIFSDNDNFQKIFQYVKNGKLPWEE
jgi:polyketide biosynthesis enoyl-CoA hydratase PksH